MKRFGIITTLLILAVALSMYGQIPRQVPYQGYIMINGVPFTGTVYMKFKIYDAINVPNPIWVSSANYVATTVINGIYNYILGNPSDVPLLADWSSARFLEVIYRTDSQTGTEYINSRIQFMSMPYAFNANFAVGSAIASQATNAYSLNMQRKTASELNNPELPDSMYQNCGDGLLNSDATAFKQGWYFIHHFHHDDNNGYAFQIAYPFYAGNTPDQRVYFRSSSGFTWTPWRMMITDREDEHPIPVGSIQAFGGGSAPNGWKVCDGTSLLRTDYPKLFEAIGTRFGAVDATHFNLPDLRGRFLRGDDNGANRDPGPRVSSKAGGATSGVGSAEEDAFQGHYHNIDIDPFYKSGAAVSLTAGARAVTADNPGYASVRAPSTDGQNGTPRTSAETRPENVAVVFIIKY